MIFAGPPLTPAPAAAAIIVSENGRYLLQHRDALPQIFFPDFWGTFGGAIDAGETPEAALRRELTEELAFEPEWMTFFCELTLDFRFAGREQMPRYFFEVPIKEKRVQDFRLGEGCALRFWDAEAIVGGAMVIPYDATAIWLHASRSRYSVG